MLLSTTSSQLELLLIKDVDTGLVGVPNLSISNGHESAFWHWPGPNHYPNSWPTNDHFPKQKRSVEGLLKYEYSTSPLGWGQHIINVSPTLMRSFRGTILCLNNILSTFVNTELKLQCLCSQPPLKHSQCNYGNIHSKWFLAACRKGIRIRQLTFNHNA